MATETTEAGGSDGSGSPGAGARLRSLAGSVLERREGSVLVGLIAIFFVGVYIDASRFLLLDNMARILRSAATTAIIGYGVALLMVTAEFDLSVGSMYGVAAGMGAIMIGGDAFGFHPLFAVAVVLVFSVVFGITQGLVVTKLGLPSLIVTIGTPRNRVSVPMVTINEGRPSFVTTSPCVMPKMTENTRTTATANRG